MKVEIKDNNVQYWAQFSIVLYFFRFDGYVASCMSTWAHGMRFLDSNAMCVNYKPYKSMWTIELQIQIDWSIVYTVQYTKLELWDENIRKLR